MGLAAVAFLVFIAVTGILMHFSTWFPSSAWVKALYRLHSGAFLGEAGRWLYDLAALALVGLGITGIVLWVRGRES